MRPYLAVLKDSFREAMSSKTLYVMLALITLFLLLLAPFTIDSEVATRLSGAELLNPEELIERMKKDSERDGPSPGKHLYALLDDKVKEEPPAGERGNRRGRDQREAINELLTNETFYDEASFESVRMDDALRTRVENLDSADESERSATNRRLMGAAFRRNINLVNDQVSYAWYGPWRIDIAIPVAPDQVAEVVNGVIMASIGIVMGFFGILVSILVTSNMVPRMFEPGEISLLLSKPVSRSLLFLTKFLGGCCFTLINVAWMVAGIWLIVGTRFGIWNHRLLLVIPIYVFLFAIYYSVSAYFGAVWRNAIVSVVMVILFWFVLFAVSQTRGVIDQLAIAPSTIYEVTPAADDILVVNGGKESYCWSEQQQDWDPVLRSDATIPAFAVRLNTTQRLRHAYDPATDSVYSLEPQLGPRGGTSDSLIIGNHIVVGADTPVEDDSEENTAETASDSDEGNDAGGHWSRQTNVRIPFGATDVFTTEAGEILVVGPGRIAQFIPDPGAAQNDQMKDWLSRMGAGALLGGDDKRFIERLDESVEQWPSSYSVDVDVRSGDLAIYSLQNLRVLKSNAEGNYTQSGSVELDIKGPTTLAFAGTHILIGDEQGVLRLIDAATLEEQQRFDAFDGVAPRVSFASPNGKYFGAISHERHLWLYDVEAGQNVTSRIPHSSRISAAVFRNDSELLVSDRTVHVLTYDVSDGRLIDAKTPSTGTLELAYRYVIDPLYFILPKPSELDNLISYLLTGERSVEIQNDGGAETLNRERVAFSLWTPILSNLAFLAVILGFACFRISRRDF